jgi:hypothetical protein
MARSERFELPALGFEVRCSIQLSYERLVCDRLPDLTGWGQQTRRAGRTKVVLAQKQGYRPPCAR